MGKFNSAGKSPASAGGELQQTLLGGGRQSPTELNDAHACGKEDVALQATRTRRSGSLCEPWIWIIETLVDTVNQRMHYVYVNKIN